MRKRVADRCATIAESATIAITDRVKALRADGGRVFDLGSGDPDFGTPEHITTEAIRAMREGRTHYPPSRGVPELLAAVADKLRRDNGIIADPATDIIVTPSAKHAMFVAMMAVLDPGDEVLVPTPTWGSYATMTTLAGARPVAVPLSARDGFTITADRLAAHVTDRTRAVVVNTPNNPTGRMLTRAEVEAIAAVGHEHDLIVLTDEIYERIVHRGAHLSLAAHPGLANRTVTVNGFSKAYAMPGWRLGYVTGPTDIVRPMLAVHQHTVAAAGSFVQFGGVAALTGPQTPVAAMAAEYSARTAFVARRLNAMPGVTCVPPDGTFYVFPEIRGTGISDSVEFASLLLDRARVVVTPGSAFGPGGEGHVRVSCVNPIDVLEEALARMGEVLSRTRSSASSIG
jgi:aspartate aminotransferase